MNTSHTGKLSNTTDTHGADLSPSAVNSNTTNPYSKSQFDRETPLPACSVASFVTAATSHSEAETVDSGYEATIRDISVFDSVDHLPSCDIEEATLALYRLDTKDTCSTSGVYLREAERLIVAIDFGTTYSGVAWIRKSEYAGRNPDSINIIDEWPAGAAPKVRSDITYDGTERILRWGYSDGLPERGTREYRFQWFKKLLPKEHRERQLQESESTFGTLFPGKLDVASIVRDYITMLLGHIMNELANGGIIRRNTLLGSLTHKLEFVITFPAIWNPETQQAYKDALAQTELENFLRANKVYYLKEPEAALIGTLHAPRRQFPRPLTELGSGANYKRIAILDAGGGTLDFAAYTVRSWDLLQLEELRIDGLQVGGTNVDGQFWDYFTKILHAHGCRVERLHRRSKHTLLESFERLKHNFPGGQYHRLSLPPDESIPYDLPLVGIQEGHLYLTPKIMEGFFNPVTTQILTFLNKQKEELGQGFSSNDTAFVLVGGFSKSAYLQAKIRKWVESTWKMKFLVPENAWTAVVSGAAKYGLCRALKVEGPVKKRLSTCSIGVIADIPWMKNKHSKKVREINPGNKQVVKNQVVWLVYKGKQLNLTRIPMRKTFHTWPDSWKETLVQSDKESPSTDLNADVKPFGELVVNAQGVPHTERMRSHYYVVKKYFKIDYQLEIWFPGADIKAHMIYNENCYGAGEFRFADVRDMHPADYGRYYEERFAGEVDV